MQDIVQYLKEAVERGASDLHLTVNCPPVVRMHGELIQLERTLITADDMYELVETLLTDEQLDELEKFRNIDLAFELPHAGYQQRFRCNCFFQKNGIDMVFRVIPREIPSLKELNLPPTIDDMTRYRDGLIIVTGATGSGKSTTISCFIDLINKNQTRHIITIEDPIEYVHRNYHSIVHQRQINLHTPSFEKAMTSALHQDPDVIMIGEMRDLRTIDMALTAATTGHLVFSTMHASNTPKAIERIIEFYPPHRQLAVRYQFADCCRAIIAQQLVPRMDGWGRIPAVEIMINCLPIANLIREFKGHQIYSVIQTSKAIGMISMDEYLTKLYDEGRITARVAYEHAIDKTKFEHLYKGAGRQA